MTKVNINLRKSLLSEEFIKQASTALSFKNSEIIAEKCLFYSEIP